MRGGLGLPERSSIRKAEMKAPGQPSASVHRQCKQHNKAEKAGAWSAVGYEIETPNLSHETQEHNGTVPWLNGLYTLRQHIHNTRDLSALLKIHQNYNLGKGFCIFKMVQNSTRSNTFKPIRISKILIGPIIKTMCSGNLWMVEFSVLRDLFFLITEFPSFSSRSILCIEQDEGRK